MRQVPLSSTQIAILKAHKDIQDQKRRGWTTDEELIFPNKDGNRLDHKVDRGNFKSLCQRAWLPEYQLYQLRKMAFSSIAAAVDTKSLQEYSGHKQISTVMNHYVFSTSEQMNRILEHQDAVRPEIQP